MMDFRQHIRQGRRTLHVRMSRPALAFMLPIDPFAVTPPQIDVRVHENWKAQGDLKGTSYHYAETQEIVPVIIFLREQITPERNMIVSLEDGLAYRVVTRLPHDDLTVTAQVTRLAPAEAAGLPYPGWTPNNLANGELTFPDFTASAEAEQ